jgi:hypothetical protein
MRSAAELERRVHITQIRGAARQGRTPREIADGQHLPLKMVQQVLSPVPDARLSDPVGILRTRTAEPGLPPADVQLYWVGFLTASGRICGQGTSFALIVTLGDRSQAHVDMLMADLTEPHVRHEFCQSSLLGWQLYIRDQTFCRALLPWGISSDMHGDDPSVIDDVPSDLVAPFLRGYVDGNWPARPRRNGLVLNGAEPVLEKIAAMIKRHWRINGAAITPQPPRAQLRFPGRGGDRAFLEHTSAYTTRARGTR